MCIRCSGYEIRCKDNRGSPIWLLYRKIIEAAPLPPRTLVGLTSSTVCGSIYANAETWEGTFLHNENANKDPPKRKGAVLLLYHGVPVQSRIYDCISRNSLQDCRECKLHASSLSVCSVYMMRSNVQVSTSKTKCVILACLGKHLQLFTFLT